MEDRKISELGFGEFPTFCETTKPILIFRMLILPKSDLYTTVRCMTRSAKTVLHRSKSASCLSRGSRII
jgi:hypothetical protein